jgi:phospholipase C
MSPYFDIATKYGFGNYFFQSNQGPSFSSHQFLFSGTAAPSGGPTAGNDYQYFAAETPKFGGVADTGCVGNPNSKVAVIDQSGNESTLPQVFPCFHHNSLPTLLDPNHISWKYYGVLGSNQEGNATGIWTAPNSIADICFPPDQTSTTCTGSDWVNDVVFGKAQILLDLGVVSKNDCALRNVSWVIPNGDRSDHPGMPHSSTASEGGPSWVADIINAVGQSPCTNADGSNYWNTTAILVVWDDWGGFWDHVAPYQILVQGHGTNCNPTTTFGCGYTSGFRVPFLVVSAYTGTPTNGGYTGYVSGACQSPGNCQNDKFPYQHDFGSILAFIENNFLGSTAIGGINRSNNYPFADALAPDFKLQPLHVPLADFFPLTTARPFQPITLPPGTPSATDFINYTGPDEDPDNDAIDND